MTYRSVIVVRSGNKSLLETYVDNRLDIIVRDVGTVGVRVGSGFIIGTRRNAVTGERSSQLNITSHACMRFTDDSIALDFNALRHAIAGAIDAPLTNTPTGKQQLLDILMQAIYTLQQGDV